MLHTTSLSSHGVAMIEAALPSHETPPRIDRIESATRACEQIQETISTDPSTWTGKCPSENVLIPLGIHATRGAIFDLIEEGEVGHQRAVEVALEVATLCKSLIRKFPLTGYSAKYLGFYAELGMLNMAWHGISEEGIDADYALLLGARGYEVDHTSFRGDVYMIVHSNPETGKKKGRRHNVQIKASDQKAKHVYADGISVITAQSIFRRRITSWQAVSKLMRWGDMQDTTKERAYEIFMKSIK